MGLPTIASLKRRFRIETDDDDELLADLLVVSIAVCETYLGRVILDDPVTPRTFGAVRASYPKVRGIRVSDLAPNNREEISTFDEYNRATNLPPATVVSGPPPLSTLPDYAQRIEPLCRQAIADYVADLYHRPDSAALTIKENGVMTQYARLVHAMPDRVRLPLDMIRQLAPV